jgi:hypothetical protein
MSGAFGSTLVAAHTPMTYVRSTDRPNTYEGECRAQAKEKFAQAERGPKNQREASRCRSRLAFSRWSNETTRSFPASAKSARGLSRKETNVEHSKESNCQAGTDDQHNQRRSIEKSRSRLDWRLDDMSSFFVHKIDPWVKSSITTDGCKIGSPGDVVNVLGDRENSSR